MGYSLSLAANNYLLFLVWMLMIIATSCLFESTNGTAAYSINVAHFGARPDGKTDSSKAFLKAWSSACSSTRPVVTVYVPRGRYVVRNVVLNGPCRSRIVMQINGTLLAPSNYWELGNSSTTTGRFWITFHRVTRMSIRGGTLDARAHSFWACRRSANNCPPGAGSIAFSWCSNIVVSGLTSVNSQMKHVTFDHCNNVLVRKVKIRAPGSSPNTDGIYISSSSAVNISGANIMTGDDCIAVGAGSRNLWMERIKCGPGHGISIGSLGNSVNEEGVQNVTVTSSTLTKTQNGVRIKSWARPSNGFATDIVFRNLIMNNVSNPIIIDQNYCPGNQGCPHQSSSVKISRVTYKNIVGTSATAVAMNLYCSKNNQCKDIKLQDIKLTYHARPATSVCVNAAGTTTGVVIPRSCLSTS